MVLRYFSYCMSLADANFFERLMPYRERLYRLALAQLQNTHDAEDAVHEALIKASHNLQTFRNESNEYTWVVRILINHCYDVQRKAQRRKKREAGGDKLEQQTTLIVDTRETPERNIELSETSQHLMDAVNDLSKNYKPLILMRYFENRSYEDIAVALEIQLGTVKSRMNQAKILLKQKLIQRGVTEDFLA
ncbi:MAG TPA: RNA polymerase sigma factor [Turneriella sp.]|nr:RNA polymerase sigma factor [Turneriella sp.]